MIFWHDSWLKKLDGTRVEKEEETTAAELERLRNRLKVVGNSNVWICQASELARPTIPVRSRSAKTKQWFRGLLAGNFTVIEMARSFSIQLFWSVRRRLLGVYPRGGRGISGTSLGLRPGDWVRVKPFESIVQTLDERGRNRGLQFTDDMRLWCGRTLRVGNRLDKIVVDGTGALRLLRDTVCLEGVTCGCSYMGFGLAGCSRCELTYWREAWLEPAKEI
jgi:hypothetical protein